MTKEEILSYLEIEDSARNKHDTLTRLYYTDRHSVIVYFLKKNQTAELMEKNIWVFYTLDNLTTPHEIKGDSISRLTLATSRE
jgi:hypothetical protein